MSVQEGDAALSVQGLCGRVGMSRQAFYKGQKARQRKVVDAEAVVQAVVQERQLQPRLGVRKLRVVLAAKLAEMGVAVGRDRFFDLLRERDLLVERVQARARTTDSNHLFRTWPNLLRHVVPGQPHQVWVGDLTYVRTDEGFVYLSLLTDGFSRKIVGYHASDTLEAEGCLKTLRMAIGQLPAWATPIHHSDRGTQYCCGEYVKMASRRKIAISMTEENHCYENGKAERVNGILKGEYMLGSTFRTKALALQAVEQAIVLYNERRPHQALQYRTPAAVHAEAA